MLTVAIPKRNKLQNIIVLTPKDGDVTDRPTFCAALADMKWHNSCCCHRRDLLSHTPRRYFLIFHGD